MLLDTPEQHTAELEKLVNWCVVALTTDEGREVTKNWVSLRQPHHLNPKQLVPTAPIKNDAYGRVEGPKEHLRIRDGFALTDERMDARSAQNEIHYCIYCHDHEGDFCSKGFPEKKGEPEKGLKRNALDVTLTGCPLDEKISEMHVLKRDGVTLGALAMIMVDNPMCPATGHRICNDCMKACIYQKQEPVNIPQTETRILTDVLNLPWGVEIYELLTRWNPLRQKQYLPKPYNGKKILVTGMGPAGFTLAHHLLMEGFAVVGIDGLKIEPLPAALINKPIRDFSAIQENLAERDMAGFGGVAEYGITVRWDKNFLKLIYLTLARRETFQVFGGVRFGGTLTIEEAWAQGFDHVAVTVGAGLPQALPVPGSMAPGMRQANDFLMALQLTGAAKADGLANLQLRLPAVVIGGGLTGIDTATEAQAYYIAQVEKIYHRYSELKRKKGDKKIRAELDEASNLILDEYLAHGAAIVDERARAKKEKRQANLLDLVRQWGGVTVAYRRALSESPAYISNHEEVTKALEEGIFYAEGLNPKEAKLDRFGHVEGLICERRTEDERGQWHDTHELVTLPARSILVATGAKPNVAYEFEHRGTFAKEDRHYQTHSLEIDEQDGTERLIPVRVAVHKKMANFGPFTSYEKDGKRISFFGDTHPVFHGNVVGAIASALRGYPQITASISGADEVGDKKEYLQFREKMAQLLSATIAGVKRLTPTTIELTVRAPLAAGRFMPGQFFRFQNYAAHAKTVAGTQLLTETLPLYGAGTNKEKDEVSLIVFERGASSKICATLKTGDPVVLMGPTGVRTRIPSDKETVLVIGDELAAAHLLAVGPAMREVGNRILYFAGFKSAKETFKQDELEEAADVIVWCAQDGAPAKARRSQDRAYGGGPVAALQKYAEHKLHEPELKLPIALQEVDFIVVIGDSALVKAFRDARRNGLAQPLQNAQKTIASISTPIQCGLKGVCSQCLQWQIDPVTGERTKAVYGCSWQDEPIEIVDLNNLDERLAQNRLQEHLSSLWLDHLFDTQKISRV